MPWDRASGGHRQKAIAGRPQVISLARGRNHGFNTNWVTEKYTVCSALNNSLTTRSYGHGTAQLYDYRVLLQHHWTWICLPVGSLATAFWSWTFTARIRQQPLRSARIQQGSILENCTALEDQRKALAMLALPSQQGGLLSDQSASQWAHSTPCTSDSTLHPCTKCCPRTALSSFSIIN